MVAVGTVVGVIGLGLGGLPARLVAAPMPNTAMRVLGHRRGKLSPRLSELASQSSFASPRAEAAALSLPVSGAGSLERDAGGRVVVEIRTSSTAPTAVARLRALGATVSNVSPAYSTVTAAVDPGALAAIGRDGDVEYVSEVLAPITAGVAARRQAASKATAAICAPTIPEGDTQMNVAAARAANGLDGTGETIGIVSDSFDLDPNASTRASADVLSGDLPGVGNPCGYTNGVQVVSDPPGSNKTDEGRAMAELAHALAPGAGLAFATDGGSQLQFADNIQHLQTIAHANVIVDDAAYLDEPFFQDGPIANAVNAASAAGVPYFSAAGNSNVIVGGNDVSSYETPSFRSTPCPASVLAIEPLLGCHNFDTTGGTDSADDITLAPHGGFGIDLQWAQPWGAVTNDYDVFLLDSLGNVIAGSALDQALLQEPVEFFGYTNQTSVAQTVKVVIAKFSGGADSRMKFLMVGASGVTSVQYNLSTGGDVVGPTIFGHNGAATAGSVAAVPFDNANASEDYSSHGPVTHYYAPTPSTAALGSPDVIDKPDFAATDNVKSVFLGNVVAGVRRFPGTSAAVAQAAGIGALLKERDPALTPAQLMATLSGTARAVATNGAPSDVGGGYIDAAAALASVVPLPDAPNTVTLVQGNSQCKVKWTVAPTNPHFPVTGYIVNTIKDGVAQAPIVTGNTGTKLLVTGLTNGSTYKFTVAAVNANGTGPHSRHSPVIVLGVLDPPSSVHAVAGDGQAQVTWLAPPARGFTITGYQVTPTLDSVAQPVQVFSDPATTETVTGLTNSGHYTFAVAAVDAFGTSALSAMSPYIAVGVPQTLPKPTVAYDGTSVTLNWVPPVTDNGSPITGYQIAAIAAGADPQNGQFFLRNYAASVTSSVISPLTLGQAYSFVASAINVRGPSLYSPDSAGVTPGVPVAPAPPTPTVSGDGSATLKWNAPVTGFPATSYTLAAYIGATLATSAVYNSAATSEVLAGLTNGTTYQFAVIGANQFGTGAPSTLSVPFKIGLPAAPGAVSALSGNGWASVHWGAASGQGSAVTKYVVTPYLGGVPGLARTFNSSATTETYPGLTNGSLYTFTVVAMNANGAGPKSKASTAVRVGTPRAPTAVGAFTGVRSATVRWTAAPDAGAAISGYIITAYIGTHPQATVTFHSTATKEVITHLTTGQIYTFTVVAVNARGDGQHSANSNHVLIK